MAEHIINSVIEAISILLKINQLEVTSVKIRLDFSFLGTKLPTVILTGEKLLLIHIKMLEENT
jgi:hypothetical protein